MDALLLLLNVSKKDALKTLLYKKDKLDTINESWLFFLIGDVLCDDIFSGPIEAAAS